MASSDVGKTVMNRLLVLCLGLLVSNMTFSANMIANGDFELGVTNFSSDYVDYTGNINRTGCSPTSGYGNPCTMESEQYAVDTDSDTYDVPYFKALGDHTFGWDGSAYTGRTGKFFISDVSGDTSLAPWISEKTIVVDSISTTYRFEAWIADVNGDPGATAQPSLQFEIGDGTNWVAIGTPLVLPSNKTNNQGWTLVAEDMTFSGTGLFQVRLRNNQTGTIGNDLGLDDISFDICSNSPSVGSVACSGAPQTINLGSLSSPSTVTTQAVTSITFTTATGNGTISDLGTANPTAHGICWSTTAAPPITENCSNEGATSSTGAFTSSLTGFTQGTTYYAQAYATSSVGTSRGGVVTFTTLADADGDSVIDANDQCPNTAAGATVDADGCADAQKDTDSDTVTDDIDNCPLIANSEQADLDSDGSGDLCDDDIDGDGIANADDEYGGDPNTAFVQLDGANPGSCVVDTKATKLDLVGADAANAPAEPINNKLSFQLSCGTPGATVTVRAFFGEALPANPAVYKLVAGVWTLIPDAIIDRSNQSVLYPITDGGPRDADGVNNGQIEDPVTVVSLPAAPAAPVPLPLWLLALIAGSLSVMGWSRLRSH